MASFTQLNIGDEPDSKTVLGEFVFSGTYSFGGETIPNLKLRGVEAVVVLPPVVRDSGGGQMYDVSYDPVNKALKAYDRGTGAEAAGSQDFSATTLKLIIIGQK